MNPHIEEVQSDDDAPWEFGAFLVENKRFKGPPVTEEAVALRQAALMLSPVWQPQLLQKASSVKMLPRILTSCSTVP
mgnify:CR=1 FL=1